MATVLPGCTFAASGDPLFEPGEALEASVLGLHITLSADPEVPEGKERTYVLMGGVRDDIEAEWALGAPVTRFNAVEVRLAFLFRKIAAAFQNHWRTRLADLRLTGSTFA